MKRIACYLLVAASILGVSGCGKTTTVVEDNTSPVSGSANFTTPSVTATTPFNGQTNASINTTISVTFSQVMKFASINAATFTVTDNLSNSIAGTFSFSGLTATFTPSAPLVINRTYTVDLSGAIQSKEGNGIKPLTWTFNTSTNVTPLQLSSHHVTDNGDLPWFGTTYAYEDISASGTQISFSSVDDASTQIPIGFTFNFYGTDYTNVYVGTNGYLTFGAADSTFSNYTFPSNDGKKRIAAYFDDLYVDGTCKVLYQVLGSAPNRKLVVQWYNVRHISGSSTDPAARGDFEIIIEESTNYITFQYKNVSNLTPNANGSSATVGLNKGDGIDDSLYSYNQSYLANGRVVTFLPTSIYGLTPLTPLNGATGVSKNPTIYAFFNKPLLGSSIDSPATTLTLVNTGTGIPVSGAVARAGAGNSVIYSFPSTTLLGLTNYTVNISTALTDIYSVGLAAPITWSFTTAP